MPFAGYRDFADCTSQNRDKDNPDAYCGSIKHKVEDKMNKGKRMKRHLMDAKEVLNMVDKALEEARGIDVIYNALSGPVAEEGDKKLTGEDAEGTQDDQAFAVAHGPDNYDKLVRKAESLQMSGLVKMAESIIKKQGGNMALPGNLKEHLQKALAEVHGREIFNPKYKQACKLLKKVCDLMESIEKEAEVVQGNSAAMVPGMGMGQGGVDAAAPAPHGGGMGQPARIHQKPRPQQRMRMARR